MELAYGPSLPTEPTATRETGGGSPDLETSPSGPTRRAASPLPEPSPETYADLKAELEERLPTLGSLSRQEATELLVSVAYERAQNAGLGSDESRAYAKEVGAFSMEMPNSLGIQNPTLASEGGGVNVEGYAKPNLSVEHGPDGPTGVNGGVRVGGEVERRGYGASFQVAAGAKVGERETTEEGITTYSATVDVSASVGGGVRVPVGGLEAAYAKGVEARYQVSMPEEVAERTDLSTVNPFNPNAMPVGTGIEMAGATYEKSDFKAFFRVLAAQTNTKEAEGISATFEKIDENTVRVQAGPTEALSVSDKAGISTPALEVMAGRADTLDGAKLLTADFDISTHEGRKAYNDFLLNGNLPKQNGNGVTGVATIEQLDYTSALGAGASVGGKPLVSLEGPENTGSVVAVTYPDGTGRVTQELRYSENVPLTITRRLDAEGNEQLADRRYAYTVDLKENAPSLEAALGGTYDAIGTSSSIREGNRIALTFTEEELNELRLLAKEAYANNPNADYLGLLTNPYGERELPAQEFAVALARNLGGTDVGFVDKLSAIAEFANPNYVNDRFALEKIPGTVTVLPPE